MGDAPIPATLTAEPRRRYAPEIENAVYFCCVEALQNASKHAGDAAAVHITVGERDDNVFFEVHDDGIGFDPDAAPAGAGLNVIRDRVAAVRGRLTVDSAPGHGTRISATIPLSPGRGRPPPR